MEKQTAVLIDRANDVSEFASKDARRFVLNGVYMNGKGTEATDGRVAIRVPYVAIDPVEFPQIANLPEERECAIVPTKAFKEAIATIPKGMALPVLECMRVSTRKDGPNVMAQMATTDLDRSRVIEAKTVDGNYPNIDQVLAKNKDPKLRICISAAILKQVADYTLKHCDKNIGVQFEFQDEFCSIHFSMVLDDGRRVEGCMMPMRMS